VADIIKVAEHLTEAFEKLASVSTGPELESFYKSKKTTPAKKPSPKPVKKQPTKNTAKGFHGALQGVASDLENALPNK